MYAIQTHFPLPTCAGGQADIITLYAQSASGMLADADHLLAEVANAKAPGRPVKVALTGLLSALWPDNDLDQAEALVPAYCALLARLKEAGADWIQIDEPILGLELPADWRNAFGPCYWHLGQSGARLMLATFSPLRENLGLACRLPVAGLHVDGVQARHELVSVCDWLPVPKVLSVGIVDGSTSMDTAASILAPLLERRRGELWIAPATTMADARGLAALKSALEHHAQLEPA